MCTLYVLIYYSPLKALQYQLTRRMIFIQVSSLANSMPRGAINSLSFYMHRSQYLPQRMHRPWCTIPSKTGPRRTTQANFASSVRRSNSSFRGELTASELFIAFQLLTASLNFLNDRNIGPRSDYEASVICYNIFKRLIPLCVH